jgi:hypothetical protein
MVFLPLGAILGPRGLQWFTPLVLARLDTAVTIALAVLGVMVGVASPGDAHLRRLLRPRASKVPSRWRGRRRDRISSRHRNPLWRAARRHRPRVDCALLHPQLGEP